MSADTRITRSKSLSAEPTMTRKKSTRNRRVAAKAHAVPANPEANDETLRIVVPGDDIANIINNMANTAINGVHSEAATHKAIRSAQKQAIQALDNLYVSIDDRAEIARGHNNGTPEELMEEVTKARKEAESVKPDYCFCRKPEDGWMVACDAPECHYEWFHEACVHALIQEKYWPRRRMEWYCPVCRVAAKF
ncbi:uncharacterized protein HMPREF1541_07776 [Cyphellophora europaea CBS 101466]|uniref:PHD-type domain-containing protein n=1 Tax=Cyphellophora europaea (strain CBS 101466) TaxID=1220924 RepID=W2RNU9_CYPE1|nr:uncharacterized protein HMPREF1541_07776 [Cyphellophora europaea CBS 101466]ETN38152.1 hypothetical protein HMPREF1541_07776 [Cyphellophora europaea CBS 101466]